MPVFNRGWSLFAQVASNDQRIPYHSVEDDKTHEAADDSSDHYDDGLPIHVPHSIWSNMYFVVPIVLIISILVGTGKMPTFSRRISPFISSARCQNQCITASTISGP